MTRTNLGCASIPRRPPRGSLAFVGMALWSASATAQAPDSTLTLHLAAALALQEFPAIRAAVAESERADAATDVATAAWYPTVTFAANATRHEEPMLVSPIHGFAPGLIPPFSRSTLQGTLALQYLLLDGGGRRGRGREARAQVEATQAELTTTTQETLHRVVFAYLRVLGNQEVLAAHDRRLLALAAERDRVTQLLAAGRAADVDLLRADAEWQRAQADRIAHSSTLTLAEQELARLLRVAPSRTRASALVPVTLADTALAGTDALLAAAREHSPRLHQAQAQLDLAHATGSVARSARWPALGVFARSNGWSDAAGHQALEWSAGAQIDFAVWTGGARRAHIAAADASARAAQAAAQLADIDVARDIDRARGDIDEARARVASLDVAVSRFHEVVRIRQLALSAGTGTQQDYLDAQADLLDAQAALIEARHRDILACSALALHTGQLDLDWLRRSLENRP